MSVVIIIIISKGPFQPPVMPIVAGRWGHVAVLWSREACVLGCAQIHPLPKVLQAPTPSEFLGQVCPGSSFQLHALPSVSVFVLASLYPAPLLNDCFLSIIANKPPKPRLCNFA